MSNSKPKTTAAKGAPAKDAQEAPAAEPVDAAKLVADALAPLQKELAALREENAAVGKELAGLRAENEAIRKELAASQVTKASKPDPPVSQDNPNILICHKGTIQVGKATIKRGDKIDRVDMEKVPRRLHRWFKPMAAE